MHVCVSIRELEQRWYRITFLASGYEQVASFLLLSVEVQILSME